MFERYTQPHTKRARTRLLGLFAAIWAGLVLQPCAFAAVAKSDCPHCPPEIEAAAVAVESHCNPATEAMPRELPNCVSVQADCCDLDEGIANLRVDTTSVDDDTPGLPTSVPASQPRLGPCEDPGSAAGPPEPSGGSVPLHVLYCLYLD